MRGATATVSTWVLSFALAAGAGCGQDSGLPGSGPPPGNTSDAGQPPATGADMHGQDATPATPDAAGQLPDVSSVGVDAPSAPDLSAPASDGPVPQPDNGPHLGIMPDLGNAGSASGGGFCDFIPLGGVGLCGGDLTPGTQGGTVIDRGASERFFFTALGDVRPSLPDVGSYPSDTISHIFTLMQARQPDFAVFLGDTLFVEPDSHFLATMQLQKFVDAKSVFTAPFYPALGNHEGGGGNLQAWQELLSPDTYYEVRFQTPMGDGKIVIIGDNTWDDTQKAWAMTTLARKTTYTFVARHHPSNNTLLDNAEIAQLVASFPVTLILSAHVHRYQRIAEREVISGNAGAPLEGTDFYGYITVEQQTNGNVAVTSYREDSDLPIDTFAVSP